MLRRLVPVALGALLSGCVEPALPMAEAAVDAGPYVCSPTTCTGCCQGNTCLGGNFDDACGYSGRACRACPTQTACQSPGACISVPRDGGATASSDAGTSDRPTDPFSGGPLVPPERKCIWVFGFPVCS